MKEKEKDMEKKWMERIRNLLDEGLNHLDGRALARLERARNQALRGAPSRYRGILIPLRWLMVGSFATATTAVLVFFSWMHSPSPGMLPAQNPDDFEIITASEQIDFYQNLDFYQWLSTRKNGERKGKST
jgi:hypothetical protein